MGCGGTDRRRNSEGSTFSRVEDVSDVAHGESREEKRRAAVEASAVGSVVEAKGGVI